MYKIFSWLLVFFGMLIFVYGIAEADQGAEGFGGLLIIFGITGAVGSLLSVFSSVAPTSSLRKQHFHPRRKR